MDRIAILMSTYNGYDYIVEQIESIYEQTYNDFQLYIRDDGSDKEFVEKLKKMREEYHFVLFEGENIGFLKSFMCLLDQVDDAELYAFADQDDIWLADKLENAVKWYADNKKDNIPQLYHCAYEVIDDEKNVYSTFYFPNEQYDFRRSITENHYSGFAMVINERLREYMLKADIDKIGYHDWWAAMIVQAFGQAYSDKKVGALHRTHGDNVTTFNLFTRTKWLVSTLKEESEIHIRSCEFKRCFGKELNEKNKNILGLFARNKYSLMIALKKCLYPKRWRPVLSSEVIMRVLMLIGKI